MKLSLLRTAAVAILAAVVSTNLCDGKKILLSFDGTDRSPFLDVPNSKTDTSFSNVLRLHLLAGGSVDNKRNHFPKDEQVCLYQRGIGAVSKHWIVRKLRKFLGFLNQQIKPMRKMLEEVYEEGDDIYIIGFSRGAASARTFVCDLEKNGLRTAITKKLVKDWEKPPVKFLGCFDTVSMQWGERFFTLLWRMAKYNIWDLIGKQYMSRHKRSSAAVGETGGKIPGIVEKAVHNVALDDNKMHTGIPNWMPPILMDSGDDRVTEVWFAGEHSDTGGSWYKKGMADFSLLHMKEWMEDAGLKFLNPKQIDEESLAGLEVSPEHLDIATNVSEIHESKFPLRGPTHRPVFVATNDNQCVLKDRSVLVHESVYLHAKAHLQQSESPYEINPWLITPPPGAGPVVVVGSLGEKLKDKTEKFQELLQQSTIMDDSDIFYDVLPY